MKKQSDVDFLRSWGITNPNFRKKHLRYQNPPEKGVYWYWFSLDIRQRDCQAYGTCISCGKPITVDTCDAGHFAPAGSCGRDLIMDPMNVHAECGRCNAFDEGHLLGYRRGLISRYGQSLVDDLERRYFEYKESKDILKDFKGHEYAEKIKALSSYKQAMLTALQKDV